MENGKLALVVLCFFFFNFHRSKVPTEVDGQFQNMQKSFFMENFDPSIKENKTSKLYRWWIKKC